MSYSLTFAGVLEEDDDNNNDISEVLPRHSELHSGVEPLELSLWSHEGEVKGRNG
jgi:hypothetical protein